MNIRSLISINALLFIGAGIAFALYGPLAMALFGIAEIQEGNSLLYWYAASFARLFGAVLFGLGFMIWAIRDAVSCVAPAHGSPPLSGGASAPGVSPEIRRGILLALVLANAAGLVVTVTQQASVWGSPAGWGMAALFLLLLLGYGYFLAREK